MKIDVDGVLRLHHGKVSLRIWGYDLGLRDLRFRGQLVLRKCCRLKGLVVIASSLGAPKKITLPWAKP